MLQQDIMVRVELSKIIIDDRRHEQIIVLKEKDGERQFPIIIGFLEASSIQHKLSGVDVPRPMTHDLLVNTVAALGAEIEKLVIDKLLANTFHAKLMVRTPAGDTVVVDSRPSDGVAVAVRSQVPIFVEEEVLEKAMQLRLD